MYCQTEPEGEQNYISKTVSTFIDDVWNRAGVRTKEKENFYFEEEHSFTRETIFRNSVCMVQHLNHHNSGYGKKPGCSWPNYKKD